MRSAHRGCMALLLLAWTVASPPALSRERSTDQAPDPGPPFQSLLDLETTARLLAILLDSGRAVINEQQDAFLAGSQAMRLTPDAFEAFLIDMFRSRSGLDLRELAASGLPAQAKQWLPLLVAVSKQVVQETDVAVTTARPNLIPAVFGSRVAGRFSTRTGVRLKQTALVPRNPANAPDPFERTILEAFAAPNHPREQPISEVTAESRTLRLMYPLYTTRQCLGCHGDPKGQPDRTGYPREGWRLGENAGAISVLIPLRK